MNVLMKVGASHNQYAVLYVVQKVRCGLNEYTARPHLDRCAVLYVGSQVDARHEGGVESLRSRGNLHSQYRPRVGVADDESAVHLFRLSHSVVDADFLLHVVQIARKTESVLMVERDAAFPAVPVVGDMFPVYVLDCENDVVQAMKMDDFCVQGVDAHQDTLRRYRLLHLAHPRRGTVPRLRNRRRVPLLSEIVHHPYRSLAFVTFT